MHQLRNFQLKQQNGEKKAIKMKAFKISFIEVKKSRFFKITNFDQKSVKKNIIKFVNNKVISRFWGIHKTD